VVVAAVTITAVLVMLFGAWPNILQRQYIVHIRFPEAPGITVDTPVRKSGVLVGRVSDVRLLDEGGVLVSAKINDKYKLRRNETCRIASGSLFGDAVLQFVPSGQAELLETFDKNQDGVLDTDERQMADQLIGDQEYMSDGVVASNPLRVLVNLEDNITAALTSIETAGDEVAQVARSVSQKVGGEENRIDQIMEQANVALGRFENAMRSVERVLGDEQMNAKLRQSLEKLPDFLDETRKTMIAAQTTMSDFQRLSKKAEVNLDHLDELVGPLGQRGAQLIENIDESTQNLNQLLVQLIAFSEAINSGQGTLGKLAYDDEIYNKIERLLTNAEELSVRLRPIVADVRTFTDKIARDPRQLGLKGALDSRPTGLKTGVRW
jgi:phospholipid/cholesterol/gamma-HCH transport system substrate-binding protein